MATIPLALRSSTLDDQVDYPTSDGRPMGETDLHRREMMDLISILEDRYADRPDVYVSGNLLVHYEQGNKKKHLSLDVLVVFGVPKEPPRLSYKIWLEGKGLDVVIEITSKSTRKEDQHQKLALHRDVLKVPEYFQFDPTEDYLRPSLQGMKLVDGRYEAITPVAGRIPSEVLGLHLERSGVDLRFYDPVSGHRLPTRREAMLEAARQAEESARQAEQAIRREAGAIREARSSARREAKAVRLANEAAQREAEAIAESARLRHEIEELRRRLGGQDA